MSLEAAVARCHGRVQDDAGHVHKLVNKFVSSTSQFTAVGDLSRKLAATTNHQIEAFCHNALNASAMRQSLSFYGQQKVETMELEWEDCSDGVIIAAQSTRTWPEEFFSARNGLLLEVTFSLGPRICT